MPAETRLLDFSSARPSISTIQASGANGVLRYLTPAGGAKAATKSELDAYRAAGLIVGLIFETTATRALAGRAAGKADALEAAKEAAALGYPTSAPIGFAVDFDAQWSQVSDYFQGIADAHIPNPIMAYGSYTVVEAALDAHLASYAWQTAAWSQGRISDAAHLYQRNYQTHPVSGTDENVMLHPLPLWGAPTPQGDDVPLTDADAAKVADEVWNRFLVHGPHGDLSLQATLGVLLASTDPTTLATAIAAKMPAGSDAAAIEAAVRAVFADAARP
jgi:hypothetical protein